MSQDVVASGISERIGERASFPPAPPRPRLHPRQPGNLPLLPNSDLIDPNLSEDQTKLESHADSLMDTLFGEVEQALDGQICLNPIIPSQPSPGGQLALQTPNLPSGRLVKLNHTRPDTLLAQLENLDVALEPSLFRGEDRTGRGLNLDALLAGAAFTSVLVSALLWFGLRAGSPSGPGPVIATGLDPESLQFSQYVGRTLDLLDFRQKQAKAAPQTAPVVPPVYLPAYPPPPITAPPALASSAIVPPPVAPALPSAVSALASPVPVIPGSGATGSIAPSSGAPSSIAPAVPAPAYSLVGVLDVGERSMAMINSNGSTKSFRVGETLSGSDWTVIAIREQEVVLRRPNQQLRSVTVGERF
ncbi:hypothetical protein [Leptolyngbya sp. FACHB-261]|uniref:hypothetical protein n=1 Tax=Leptolyngbya sp. FACHB-261 TaxID=2692806 RepID=UPI001688E64B|nr:hypothetical protein [Leptolyngbya sp. FACHB-261]MBD2103286.1 hypothetical protein [Leptolyngbya sp. FACHB-261]